jgi:hypothetical protein
MDGIIILGGAILIVFVMFIWNTIAHTERQRWQERAETISHGIDAVDRPRSSGGGMLWWVMGFFLVVGLWVISQV